MRIRRFYCDECGEIVFVPGTNAQTMEDAKSIHMWDEHGVDTRPEPEPDPEVEVLDVDG